MKKYIVLLMIFGLFLGGASKVGAVSVKDLQNQIQILSSQINSLQNNLSAAIVKVAQTASSKKFYMGSSGDEVKMIQEALKNKGFFKDKVDGKFGINTLRAVLAFQKENKLTANGVLDEASLRLLVPSLVDNSDSSDKCDSTTPPSITVLSPNGGETYTAGQKITLKWKTCNISANALLTVYLDYNGYSLNIGNSGQFMTLNDGSEIITLPNVSAYGNLFKMHIVQDDFTLNPPVDTSDNTFTINNTSTPVVNNNCNSSTTPWIKVTSPNGGEVYNISNPTPGIDFPIKVTWETCNIPPQTSINVNLLDTQHNAVNSLAVPVLNNGKTTANFHTILFSPIGSMNFGNYYKIQIVAQLASGIIVDESDNLFTINSNSTSVDPLVTYVWNTGFSDLTSTSVVLHGKAIVQYSSSSNTPLVNISNGGHFVYDSSNAGVINLGFNNSTPFMPMQNSGGIPLTGLISELHYSLSGLTPNTTYCFRAQVKRTNLNTNQSTFNHSEPQTCFTTLPN